MSDDEKLGALNSEVTGAIMRAEAHDYEGSKLWDDVARCELAIADHLKNLPGKEVEYEIAKRGVRTAKARAKLLQQARAKLLQQEEGGENELRGVSSQT